VTTLDEPAVEAMAAAIHETWRDLALKGGTYWSSSSPTGYRALIVP